MGTARPIARLSRRPLLLALLVTLGALLLRLPGLQTRPFHTDEAVNAFILEEVFATGYHYRVHDHHGPTLYQAAAAVLGPLGIRHPAQMEPWMLRGFSAFFGALLAAASFGVLPEVSLATRAGGAAAVGLAAPFVYYSGIFIHEMLLMLLLLLFFGLFWRLARAWVCDRRPAWRLAVLAGVCAGLMLATKETAAPILVVVVAAVGIAHLRAFRGGPGSDGSDAASSSWPLAASGAVAVIAALAVVALCFSGFGRHPDQALGLFSAIIPQLRRGTGMEHAYPVVTYLQWLARPTGAGVPWSGWLLPGFALVGTWTSRRTGLGWALATWALLLFAFFSLLPYKTPWLMLAWLLPVALLAGLGWGSLWERRRAWALGVGAAAVGLLGWETHQRCQVHAVDPANTLAYSPSSPDLARLESDLEALAARTPGGREGLLVQVIAEDYWPLPWTLRHFPRTGFWTEPPGRVAAGAVLSGPEYIGHLATGGAKFEPYSLRPGVFIFLRKDPPPS